MNPTQRLRPFLYGGHGGDLVEDMRSYKPGGFHPVHLGDTFSLCPGSDRPRYRILQKLGQGALSTVWLAQDMADHEYVVFFKALVRNWSLATPPSRGVALKITTADVQDHEAAILQTLSSGDKSHRGKKHVLQLLDHFQIHGPNGIHNVLVTDILVPKQFLIDFCMLDPKKTSYETLLALAYLSESGVIHGGASCHFISRRYSTYLPSRSACRQYNVFVPWTSRAYHGSLDGYSWISLFSSCCSSEFRGTKWLYPNTWWRPPKSRMLLSPFWTNTEKKASMQ